MRISDWSSDVCSSDLTMGHHFAFEAREGLRMVNIYPEKPFEADIVYYNPDDFGRGYFSLNYGEEALELNYYPDHGNETTFQLRQEIGNASWRDGVCKYV